MRIGIDVRCTQTPDGGRGLARYTVDLVRSLLRYAPGHELVLFVREGSPLPAPLANLSARFEARAIRSQAWHDRRLPLVLRLPRIRSHVGLQRWHGAHLRRENQRALTQAVAEARLDVLHFPSAPDLNSFPSGRFAVPVVRTFADATPLVMRDEYYDLWPAMMKDHYDEQIESMREADAVTAFSDSSRRDAIAYANVRPEAITTVHCAVADEWIPVDDERAIAACRARHGIEGDTFVFCSQNAPNKNLLGLVRAFALLRETAFERPPQLVLVTSDSDENAIPIVKEAWRLGLSRRDVILTGRISDEEMRILFGGAAALVSPSFYEGFGLPAAEALRLGTPVLASRVSSLPEVVGEAGLLFDPHSEAEIADAMRRVLTDDALRRALAGRAKAQGEPFSFERQARAMTAVYEGVVGGGAVPGDLAHGIGSSSP